MSVKVMAAVWECDALDASERLVMLSLADHADDSGRCYPSIARLCRRTSMSDRGVQKVLARLVERGFIAIQQNAGQGGANLYRITATPEHSSPLNDVHPRTTFATPPNPVRKTPEPRSPKPSITIKEPSEKSAHEARDIRAALLEVVSEETADAFIDHRRVKRAKLTPRAARMIADDLRGHHDADEVMRTSIKNGWTGVFPEKHRSTRQPTASEIMARISQDKMQ